MGERRERGEVHIKWEKDGRGGRCTLNGRKTGEGGGAHEMGETRVGGGRHEIPKDWRITQLGVGHVQVMRLPQRYDLSARNPYGSVKPDKTRHCTDNIPS